MYVCISLHLYSTPRKRTPYRNVLIYTKIFELIFSNNDVRFIICIAYAALLKRRFIYIHTNKHCPLNSMQAKPAHTFRYIVKNSSVCDAREEIERNQNKFANLNKSYCEIIVSMNYVCFTMKN